MPIRLSADARIEPSSSWSRKRSFPSRFTKRSKIRSSLTTAPRQQERRSKLWGIYQPKHSKSDGLVVVQIVGTPEGRSFIGGGASGRSAAPKRNDAACSARTRGPQALKNKSPEVMLISFVSASSSLLTLADLH